MKAPSSLERKFELLWRAHGGLRLLREYRFHETRKFRFDFVIDPQFYPGTRIAFEMEGGVYIRGAHNRPARFCRDCEKYYLAALGGWILWRFSPNMIDGEHIRPVIEWCQRSVPHAEERFPSNQQQQTMRGIA